MYDSMPPLIPLRSVSTFRNPEVFIQNYFLSVEDLPSSSLELVHIFFDTASYDEIVRDKKIKFEGQLSLIGGTMGLLTGFSIISGVEILYFATRFFAGFIKSKIEIYLPIPMKNDEQ